MKCFRNISITILQILIIENDRSVLEYVHFNKYLTPTKGESIRTDPVELLMKIPKHYQDSLQTTQGI